MGAGLFPLFPILQCMFFRKKYTSKNSDEELVGGVTENNASALEVLFDRYRHLVLGIALKYLKDPEESKDVVMDVFEKMPESLKKHNVRNFKSWLHTVAKNRCLMILRQKREFPSIKEEHPEIEKEIMEMEAIWHPIYNAEKEKEFQLLETAINKLNVEQKTCIELFYLQERSYREIVESTGYSLLQVKSFIQNGKRNLKIIMQNHHGE